MRNYYRPTENPNLMNFHFGALTQENNKAFHTFCNKVMKEAKQCHIKCHNEDCIAEDVKTSDQVITGLKNTTTCEDTLKKS